MTVISYSNFFKISYTYSKKHKSEKNPLIKCFWEKNFLSPESDRHGFFDLCVRNSMEIKKKNSEK